MVRSSYEPIEETTLPDGVQSLHSDVLGLAIRLEAGRMYFYDVERGEKLLTHDEAEQGRLEAEARAQHEAKARQAAEARIAELTARLRALEERPPE